MTNRLFSNKTFQRLQKERESEEKKLEASRATLQEQQQQLEKEIADQKNMLDQVLSQVLGAKERARTLQQEERWGETLEKTLSQTRKYPGALPGAGAWQRGAPADCPALAVAQAGGRSGMGAVQPLTQSFGSCES